MTLPLMIFQSMTWALRLKRVFTIDIKTCMACQGQVKIIACIEDPDVIKKIYLTSKAMKKKHLISLLK